MSDSDNTITALRAELFATIRGVRAGTVDLEHAKVVSDLSQVIINSAKVEVEFVKAAGGGGSGFIPSEGAPKVTQTQNGMKLVTQENGQTVTRHTMR